jgi:multidrug efflux system membrane fusion protein
MTKELWMLIAGAIGVSSLTGCRTERAVEKPLTPVSVGVVDRSAPAGGVRYSGNVEPKSRVDLSYRVPGYVEEIAMVRRPDGTQRPIQEGDTVTKGMVLARLREPDYQAKVEQAKSQLSQAVLGVAQAKSQLQEAQAALEKAKADFERASNLFKSQSLTRADFDGAKAGLEMTQARFDQARTMPDLAQARLEGAQAMVREAELALSDCALRAPLDAVVLKKFLEVGSLVAPGVPAFSLADTTSVKIVFGAPDAALPFVRPGATLTVTTEAVAGAEFQGRVTRVSPAADPRSRVFEVEITVPNPDNRLKAGMIAAVELPGAKVREPELVVPLTAIVRSKDNPDGYGVFVVEEQGGRATARARNVRLGETFGNRIAVTQGVKAGERVIVTGATLVRDGEQVQIIP